MEGDDQFYGSDYPTMYENNDGIRSELSFLLMISQARGAFHQNKNCKGIRLGSMLYRGILSNNRFFANG